MEDMTLLSMMEVSFISDTALFSLTGRFIPLLRFAVFGGVGNPAPHKYLNMITT